MSKRQGRKIKGFGALSILFTLFLASFALRLGDIGLAYASARDTLESPAPVAKGRCENCADREELARLLEMLNTREKKIAAKEKQLREKEKLLKSSEEMIAVNLANLEAAEAKLADTIAQVNGASASDIERLTDVYESMKPKQAAALFEQMSSEFAAGFLSQMSPEAAAGILSGLSTEKGYAISVVLAGRNANAPTLEQN